jgi:cell wall-associated NlpC family hydrolase
LQVLNPYWKRRRAAAALALAAALATGCASTGAVPRPFPTPGGHVDAGSEHREELLASGTGAAIAQTALALRGVPYQSGGASPDGFDCSGLVQYVMAQHGLGVPRVVEDQARLGREIDEDRIQAGDLIFFAIDSRRPSHVGIALDADRFVHAPKTGQHVRIDTLSSTYWRDRYVEARRVETVPSGGAVLPLGDESP